MSHPDNISPVCFLERVPSNCSALLASFVLFAIEPKRVGSAFPIIFQPTSDEIPAFLDILDIFSADASFQNISISAA